MFFENMDENLKKAKLRHHVAQIPCNIENHGRQRMVTPCRGNSQMVARCCVESQIALTAAATHRWQLSAAVCLADDRRPCLERIGISR